MAFLEQILMQLKAEGYIESAAANMVGIFLRVPGEYLYWAGYPSDRCPLAPISCVSQTAYER